MGKKLVENLLHKELSYQIHGAAIEVRKDFGPGHKEKLYQGAFTEELKRREIPFRKEKAIKIYSPKDGKYIGLYRPDFIIDDKIIVEIKAEKFVSRNEIKRIYDYLRNSQYELAYFINFASPQLFVRRIIYTNDRKPFNKKNNPSSNTNTKLNNAKSLLVLLVLIGLILVSISGLCSAKEQEIKLFVAPEMFELEVERGGILEDKIKIFNKSELPVPIETTVTNFGAQEETGTITFFEEPKKRVEEEDDISYNPRKWIKIENPNFILDPGETEEIKFSVSIPENAEPGGHYAVALFEPKLPSFYFEEKAVRAIPKIGVLFLFSVKVEGLEGAKEPLTIVEFAIPEKFHLQKLEDFFIKTVKAAEELIIVEKSHLPFTLSIKNNDIYHQKPEGKLVILKGNGKIAGETEIKETTILPGKTRKFPVEFKPDLPEILKKYLPASISDFISKNFLFGKYKAHLFLKTEDNIIEKDIEFWAFPWKIALSTGLFAFLFLIFLIKYRKRIKLAFLVMFRGAKTQQMK